MLTAVIVILILAVLAILGLAAMKPGTFTLGRETQINAKPEKLFALINDFHEWPKWSPWEKLDPALNRNHSGAASGKGAIYSWEGNKKVGQGRMEIIESSSSGIKIKLDFLKPFEAHNIADFTLEPGGGGTQLTWVMTGPLSFMMKLMHVFMNMDKLIGKDFETGLANLKAEAESQV